MHWKARLPRSTCSGFIHCGQHPQFIRQLSPFRAADPPAVVFFAAVNIRNQGQAHYSCYRVEWRRRAGREQSSGANSPRHLSGRTHITPGGSDRSVRYSSLKWARAPAGIQLLGRGVVGGARPIAACSRPVTSDSSVRASLTKDRPIGTVRVPMAKSRGIDHRQDQIFGASSCRFLCGIWPDFQWPCI